MGKKRRIITNPKKFGVKHFEFLDNMDGVDDNVISDSRVPKTFRTLGLSQNNDQTISVSAQLFGSCSLDSKVILTVLTTGGVQLAAAVVSAEEPGIASSGSGASAGFTFSTTLPALQRADAGPFVLPEGRVTVHCALSGNLGISKSEHVAVKRRPLALREDDLITIIQTGATSNGKLQLDMATGISSSFGPQHGSGSGVGYGGFYWSKRPPGSPGHGFKVTLSGSLTGSLVPLTASMARLTSSDSTVELMTSASVEALDPQNLTVTYIPLDVNGDEMALDSVSTVISVPFA